MSHTPGKIEKIQDEALRIIWDDGHNSHFTFRYLRQECRCAACRDELSGKPLIDIDKVPETLGASDAATVGNYALSFRFSDGHSTGLYTFEMLRSICRCEVCTKERAAS